MEQPIPTPPKDQEQRVRGQRVLLEVENEDNRENLG